MTQPAPEVATPPAQPRGPVRAFSALRQRNFRLFWFGQMISVTGTYMQVIGQAWLVLELTHSPLQLGVVGALQYLGILLFALFGGVFADRWPKRTILLCTQTLSMLQAGALWALIASGTIQLWHLYALALLLGLTNSLDRPTRQAFVMELVGRADLPNAVGLNSSLGNLARVVGPGLGGVLIAATGVQTLFLINAYSYLAPLAALVFIRAGELHGQPRRSEGKSAGIWASLGEGFAYIWATPAVCMVIVVVGVALLFGSNFNVLLPLFATDVLHIGATGFGLLSAAMAAGSLLAALWMAWGNRRPTTRRVLTAAVGFAVVEGVFALSHSAPLSLALIALVGFAETSYAEFGMMLVQLVAPDHLRGRVMSVCTLFFDGSVPMGYLLTGALSQRAGPALALLICAGLCLLVVAAGWVWRGLAIHEGHEAAQG
ncbi:MAG: MFS transporter [Ktedonobacterales bacterium]